MYGTKFFYRLSACLSTQDCDGMSVYEGDVYAVVQTVLTTGDML
jgi:hypothetical protein